MENTFRIPAQNLDTLLQRLNKLAKRAKRNHLPAITWQEGEIEKVVDEETGKVRVYHHLTVSGPAPKINGWTFVATLDHVALDVSVVKAVPGTIEEGDLKAYRTANANCDHCKKYRPRKDTYVLRSDAGEFKQVGSSCLKDFLGHASPEMLAEWAEFLADAQGNQADDDMLSFGGASLHYLGIQRFLSYVAQAMRLHGWVSKKQAEEQLKLATSSRALDEMLDAPTCHNHFKCHHAHEEPTAADLARATAALEWIRGKESQVANLPDYIYNLWAACREEAMSLRNTGLVASLISAYERETAKALEQQHQAQVSQHIGAPGEKITVQVTVTSAFQMEASYGYGQSVTTKYILRDDASNVLVWWSSKGELKQGETYHLKATIKEHTEWHGIKQTVITRAKVA